MIHTAIRAAQDNINSYVNAQTYPVMFNVNVALLSPGTSLMIGIAPSLILTASSSATPVLVHQLQCARQV
jgi:hypothetical protein